MLLVMIPKVLELRNERLEDFEDLVSEDDDEEEKIGEGRIELVQEEEDIVALFFVLLLN